MWIRRWTAFSIIAFVGCRRHTEDPSPQNPIIVPEPPHERPDCEAELTTGPGPRMWVNSCEADGRHLVTCWAGHRAILAAGVRCRRRRDRRLERPLSLGGGGAVSGPESLASARCVAKIFFRCHRNVGGGKKFCGAAKASNEGSQHVRRRPRMSLFRVYTLAMFSVTVSRIERKQVVPSARLK